MKILLLYLIFLSTACAHITYIGSPDGSTKVSIYTLGSDKLIKDFNGLVDSKGNRHISIGSLDENQTEGMKQANQGLKMLMEGLAKGAVEGIK